MVVAGEDKSPLIEGRHEEILTSTFLGTLSTLRHTDGRISTNPVSFIWNGAEIEISTLKSRMKYKNLRASPAATMCVISPHNHMAYVEIRGTVRLVDDPDREYIRHSFIALTGAEPPPDMDPPGAERVTVYLRPEQVSSPVLYGGRFDQS